MLVSDDGLNYQTIARVAVDTTEFVYEAEGGGAELQFLLLSIDAAGNVETAPVGTRLPSIEPMLNLGAPPIARAVRIMPIPRATAESETPANRLFAAVAAGVPSLPSSTSPSRFATVWEPFAAERFSAGFGDSGAGIGALAMTVSPDGNFVYASGGAGRNELYRIPVRQAASRSVTRLAGYATNEPIYELVFDGAGQLWATTGGLGLVQLDPTNGRILDSAGFGVALGLAAVPGETELLVATTEGIQRFDTATRRFSPFSDTRVDALVVASDGTPYGTAWPDHGQVLRFDFRGRPEIIAELDGPAESLALGTGGTVSEGLLLVGGERDGKLTAVDLASLRSITIASGGAARIEGLESLPDGRMLVTQADQIDVLFPIAAPRVIATTPVAGDAVVPVVNMATVTFDVGVMATDEADAKSANNPKNFTLTNLDTGQQLPIAAARYDEASRTSRLIIESLPPANYQLQVSPTITSEQGVTLGGNGFAADFSVLDDVTASTSIEFSNTRLNRGNGTLLVDMRVSNDSTVDFSGPVRVTFDALVGEGFDVTGLLDGNPLAAGVSSGVPYVEVVPQGVSFEAAARSDWVTIVVDNPRLLEVDPRTRVLAGLPANALPVFSTSPALEGNVGEAYAYDADANDSDGTSLTYVLVKAPASATVNPDSGVVEWMPERADDAESEFELRVYDSRGAYQSQTWTVDLSGANHPPQMAALQPVSAREGDLLEIPFSASDPDGDALFYWADRLPPGAILDPVAQAIRWRPDGNAAGRYQNVTVFASDGIAITSGSLEILVGNRNQPPKLSPIADRSVLEGDPLTFVVHANDIDGDAIRFGADILPPGASIDPLSGVFDWTPGFNQHGVFEIVVFADDGQQRATETVTITVGNVNGQVAFPKLDAFNLFEGQAITLRIAATDPDYPSSSADPLLFNEDFFVEQGLLLAPLDYSFSPLPDGASYDPATQIFQWQPGFDQAGDYEVTFTATDSGDGTGVASTDTVALRLTVWDANGRPEFTPVDSQTMSVGESLVIPIEAIDPEGQAITLTASLDETVVGSRLSLPGFLNFSDAGDGTGMLTANPVAGDRGSYLIVLRAAEASGTTPLTNATMFVLNVTSDNEPPVFDPLPGRRVALVGEEVVIDIHVSDPDQDPLTFGEVALPNGSRI